MSIASRITSIEEHIKESYQELEGLGIDTTGVNNNLENIPKLLDGYWETLPKVTDEGTSITLDNTKEGKMKVLLKGNTYQDSTTGKNLIGTNYITGVTINDTTTNDITIRGNWASTIVSNANLLNILEPSTTYTISYKYKVLERPSSFGTNNSVYILGLYDGGSGLTFFGETQKNTIALNTWDTITRTFTTPASLTNYRMIAYDFKDTNNTTTGAIEVSELQIEKGSSATTFEIFTYGASPNPDYPQPIQVVSGDNEITICGKNLIDTIEYNRGINSSGVISGVDNHYLGINDFVPCKPSTTYSITFKHDISTLSLYIGYKDKNGNFLNRTSSSSRTFTTPNNAYYLFAYVYKDDRFNVSGGYVQLEYGTPTPYEPYKSQSYPVNLPIENILDITSSGSSIGGVPFTIENGIIKINGTTSSSTASYYFNTFRAKSESAVFSIEVTGYTDKSSGNSALILQQSDDGTTGWSTLSELSLNSVYAKQNSVTLDSSKYYRLRWYVDNNTFTNATIKAQLEYGNKKNSFTPYGTTPIELCKIGTYQDKFIRTRGKNLVDILNGTIVKRESATYTNINRTANTLSYNITTAVAGYLGFVIPIEIGKQYTLSFDRTSGYIYTIELDNMITEVGTNYGSPRTSGYSFTATKPYIGIWAIANTDGGSYASISNLILNEGTTALPYEPYGNGEWYLEKKVRHTSLNVSDMDNSEEYPGWTNQTELKNDYSGLNTNLGSATDYLCNIGVESNTFNVDSVLVNTRTSGIVMLNRNVFHLTQTQWMTNYPNLVVELYYGLQTPEYIKIEGELANQLNVLNGVKSYNSQTNISQENNDLASILNATALEDM